jgi:hypothetical protein
MLAGDAGGFESRLEITSRSDLITVSLTADANMSLPAYETLGAFYLGREVDATTGEDHAQPLLYDSRDLTTHAICVGMTGSGKTGLCLSLLEEAAIDGIPAIAIDPKGDIGNLALTFPQLRPEDFAPWVDPGEAARKGLTPDALAAKTAATWRQGLAQWDQDGARIQRLRDAADVVIYTPGSDSGRPLSILRSFAAPPAELRADATALRERISGTVSGVLGMIGVDADPVQSREHILLSSLLSHAWTNGNDIDLAGLIQGVQKPPFDKIGVFDLETFYPAKQRLALAMSLNNLLAAPGFAAWLHGEPLDIQRLLYGENGKPRISVISIAHLNDAERMLVVTLILSEVVAWMRRQSGTSSLRAIVYMDEIFGYFPPSAMPPSKLPLLTLMKQARAFGVGVVLATQNPVDLDYKGLSNAGTWLIGRLQTERDKQRLIDGLLSADDGALDRGTIERLLANLGNRVFLMRNVHDDAPVLFRTRWALSYLRGPLTLQEIAKLSPADAAATPRPAAPTGLHVATAPAATPTTSAAKPPIPTDVPEYYTRATSAQPTYAPRLFATARLHFVDKKLGIDAWETRSYLVRPTDDGEVDWAEADEATALKNTLETQPAPNAQFATVPSKLLHAPNYANWKKQLAGHLQRAEALPVVRCPATGATMAPGDDEAAFRARLALALREKRDAEVERLRQKYAPRLARLDDQMRRAEDRVERERAQLSDRKMQTVVSVGTSLLGALFGRKGLSVANANRVGTAARNAGRISREKQDVERATESLEVLIQRRAELEREFQAEVERVQQALDPATANVEKTTIPPRKTDMEVLELAIVWQAQ